MHTKSVDISVIVLAYNQQESISRTLDSILAQESQYSMEIIIGEDSSSDLTRSVCEQYVHDYPEVIKMMPKVANKGVLKNYIDCVSVARGRYMAACAGDDWWHNPGKIQMQVDFLESNPDYGIVHTDFDVYYVDKGSLVKVSLNRTPPDGEIFLALLRANFITAATCLYRRELLKYVDFADYTNAGIKIEDYPMWLEMSMHAKTHYINHSTVTYSMMSNSLSHSTDIVRQLGFIDQIHLIQKYFLNKYPQPNFSSEWLETIYHRTRYMALLEFKLYKESFTEVPHLGFKSLKQFALRTYIGAVVCRWVLNSKLYKRTKGY